MANFMLDGTLPRDSDYNSFIKDQGLKILKKSGIEQHKEMKNGITNPADY